MKKLRLQKETLRSISADQVQQVAAGMRDTWACPPDTKNCPPTAPYKGCDTLKTDCCDLGL